MKTLQGMNKLCALTGTVLALASLGLAAHAQGPGEPGGPPPGQQGPGGPGGPGRPGPGGPPDHLITAADAPLPMLDRALALTAVERDQIAQIQGQFRKDVRDLMPPPPMPGSPPPDPADRKASEEKADALAKKASGQIISLLTADQQKQLPLVLADLNDFRLAGIPQPVIQRLGITKDQRGQIAAIAVKTRQLIKDAKDAAGDPRETHEKIGQLLHEARDAAMQTLTGAQRGTIEQFIQDHPMPGGPGGPDGPGGGPNGPPPPPSE